MIVSSDYLSCTNNSFNSNVIIECIFKYIYIYKFELINIILRAM